MLFGRVGYDALFLLSVGWLMGGQNKLKLFKNASRRAMSTSAPESPA